MIIYMKAVLVHFDDATYRSLNKLAPARKRRRSQFIREAVMQAIRGIEEEHMRRAYEAQPLDAHVPGDWTGFGEYQP